MHLLQRIKDVADGSIIKEKTNFIDGLNKFNGLLTKNVFDEESIRFVIEKYNIGNFIQKKLFSYMYSYPWIITYLNKYMNYLGVGSCNIIEFIKSYRYVLSCNGVLDSRRFYYMKSTDRKDDLQMKIINLLSRYFLEIYELNFNYKELLFYYDLYLNGIITNQDIYEIDMLLNNNLKTINLPDFQPQKRNERPVPIAKLIKQFSESSRDVDFINNEIRKKKMEICGACRHFGKELVPFDGNIENINDVDVLLVNLHPDMSDLREKRTFRETNIVRQNISQFPKDTKWLLINLSPCAFKSKSELGKDVNEIEDHLIGCNKLVLDFIKKNLNPKITILIGREAALAFLPDAVFEDSLGNLVQDRYVSVLHPNSMKQVKIQIKGKKYWENVQELIRNCLKKEILQKKPEAIKEDSGASEPEQHEPIVIEKIKKKDKLLLLDVKEIEDGKSVLLIFTDEEGNKHYDKRRNATIGYIKESNFKECSILTDSVDIEFTMNKMEKLKLNKLLREKMAKLKGN